MKKVLVLDRPLYNINYLKSDKFKVISVAITAESKKDLLAEGLEVVACFEEEYNSLTPSDFGNDYLLNSFDSDRFLRNYSYEKRLEILGKEITFWGQIYDKYKPDLVINEVISLEIMEVMFLEAKKRNIPFKSWMLWAFNHKLLWTDDPFKSSMPKEYWDSTVVTEQNILDAKKFISEVREKHEKSFNIPKKDPELRGLWNATFSLLYSYYSRFKRKKKGNFLYEDYVEIFKTWLNYRWCLLKHNYDTFVKDDGVEYFYYPLHVEPEATVIYYGDGYDDQPMVISRVAHSLKINQKLIVREHPLQRGVLMTKQYQDLKKRYKNLIYIDGKDPQHEIFNAAKCIVSLSGTPGYEALICGKPVILFGQVYYKDCTGATPCDSFRQLKSIIRNELYSTPDEAKLVEFVSKVFARYSDAFPFLINGELLEEDLNKMSRKMEEFLGVD